MANIECCKSALFALLLCAIAAGSVVSDELQVGFYHATCPIAESIVFEVVERAFLSSPGTAAGLIRMHFHDCFVRGCDASVLIDSNPKLGIVAEKDAPANNPSLVAFDVIDIAKTKLEAICPKTVSCADILAFAARDSVKLASPPGTPLSLKDYAVPAGRKDGRISLASEVQANVPAPTFNVKQLTQSFSAKGLSQEDMVILSGAHTIGVSHCSSFTDRLYNFNTTVQTDPSLDPYYANLVLKAQCPKGDYRNNQTTVPMESKTSLILDNLYYAEVKAHRGLFTSDAALLTDPNTLNIVNQNSGIDMIAWHKKFTAAMVKMGQIGVLTGSQGEIRVNCRCTNN
eukprot:PITA_00910